MTNEELVQRIQRGEDLRLQLWQQIERFVELRAGDYFRSLDGCRGVDAEDLKQAGYFAMVDAAALYDPEKGCTFVSYLSHHLHRHFVLTAGLQTERSKADPVNSKISTDQPVKDEDAATLGDLQADPHNGIEDAETRLQNDQLRATLEKAIAKLQPKDAEAIRLRYFDNMTRKDAAEAAGTTPEAIRQREAKGLRELRRSPFRKELEYYVEDRTSWYFQRSFRVSQASPVEDIVIFREHLAEQYRAQRKRREISGGLLRRHRKA